MKKLEAHFGGEATYFVGTLCINGCQTFNLEQAPAVFAKFQVPQHCQEDVLVNLPQPDWEFADDSNLKIALAKCSQVPPHVLAVLGKDVLWYVRYLVACNRNTAPAVLTELASDPDVEVRQAVACHRHTPVESLAILAKDYEWAVRRLVEKHPNAPANKTVEAIAST